MYKDFTTMPVWEKAMNIAEQCFHLTENLPRKEDYALTAQLRRSSLSISANIAEGFGRRTPNDKRRFYDIARGSAFETKNHLIYGSNVQYFQEEQSQKINITIDEIIHELNKINFHLKQSQSKPQPKS